MQFSAARRFPVNGMAAVTLSVIEDAIACVTLNSRNSLNAADGSLVDATRAALDALSGYKFRAAILTGVGHALCTLDQPRNTCETFTKSAAMPDTRAFEINCKGLADQLTRLYELPIPVIAAVNGVAVGGWLALALHCDVRIASNDARFGSVVTGVRSMDLGTSYLLANIVGAGVARELMLTARIIGADEAHRLNLVHAVVARGNLMTAALDTARATLSRG